MLLWGPARQTVSLDRLRGQCVQPGSLEGLTLEPVPGLLSVRRTSQGTSIFCLEASPSSAQLCLCLCLSIPSFLLYILHLLRSYFFNIIALLTRCPCRGGERCASQGLLRHLQHHSRTHKTINLKIGLPRTHLLNFKFYLQAALAGLDWT